MTSYTYNDFIRVLNESNSLNFLKKMEKASSVDDTLKLFNSIFNCRPGYDVYFWKDTYIPVHYTVINKNILRIFGETENPSEDDLTKSLVNLRGEYEEYSLTADNKRGHCQ